MKFRKRVAALALSASLLTGGAIALAPSAAAVGGNSKCTADFSGKVSASSTNLRSGPATPYSSYGLLSTGTKVTVICYRQTSVTVQPWLYLKVTSGAHSGTYGWVRDDLVNWPL
ncbi:SH3 domain-containing protein (plasmid) [Streptomyces sp. NBC_01591]|uniref:SH3 domain-containing protein n=1 Tax=Streptomyces sp. NBC_01591 TaxID=2975888 RepID=UPI002DD82385|nr:SH3 domain-containing protein [Streptomyces sp. NBC_01591]WSD74119.1 SH3 domain-containing protein [Streptomyces sp. NBC_01591]